jgi:murein DD-endopeptidase MepM/ murein hydrolase activator NlpD
MMDRGKYKEEKKYISIIFVPHSLKRVKVFRLSACYQKLVLALVIVVTVITCTGIFMGQIIKENNTLRRNVSKLQSTNIEQNWLLKEKAGEINRLKVRDKEISRKVDGFIEKYAEITENYISGRIDGSSISRSGDRNERSFSNDIKELKEILDSLNQLKSSEDEGLIDLSETESKLKKFLDSIPTFWPASGRISSKFGDRRDPFAGRKRFHEGIDIAASYGDDIRASAGGKVTLAKSYSGYGRTVIIDHGRGITTLYGHASNLLVKEGQAVSKGQVIAKVGSSGRSTGPHLHFEIRINDQAVDPLNYLD